MSTTTRPRRRTAIFGLALLTVLLAVLWISESRAQEENYAGPRALTNAELQLTIRKAGLGINDSTGNNRAQLWVNNRGRAGTAITDKRSRIMEQMVKQGKAIKYRDEHGDLIYQRATVQIRAGGGDDLILLGHRIRRVDRGRYYPDQLDSWGCDPAAGEGNTPACLIVEAIFTKQGAIANGGSGSDTIIGSEEADILFTGNTPRDGGTDRLDGLLGDDVLISNSKIAGGIAMMYGGPGNDTFFSRGQATSHMFGEWGSNTYVLGDGPDHVHIRTRGQKQNTDVIYFFEPGVDVWSRSTELEYDGTRDIKPFDTSLLPSVELLGRTFTLSADAVNPLMVETVYTAKNLTSCSECGKTVIWAWGPDDPVGAPLPEWYVPSEE